MIISVRPWRRIHWIPSPYVRFAVNCDQSNIAVKRGEDKNPDCWQVTFIRKGKKREKRKEQKQKFWDRECRNRSDPLEMSSLKGRRERSSVAESIPRNQQIKSVFETFSPAYLSLLRFYRSECPVLYMDIHIDIMLQSRRKKKKKLTSLFHCILSKFFKDCNKHNRM